MLIMSSFIYKTTVSRVLRKEGNEGNGYYTAKKGSGELWGSS